MRTRHGCGGQCACVRQVPSKASIWFCMSLAGENARFDYNIGVISVQSNNTASVSTSRTTKGKGQQETDVRWELEKALTASSEHCLPLTGVDDESGTRKLVGVISKPAEDGDLLVEIPDRSIRCVYLVLRKASSDLYEIVGLASIEPGTILERPEDPALSGIDLWLDAKDILAYAVPLRDSIGEALDGRPPEVDGLSALLDRSFTRARFSSFATICSHTAVPRQHRYSSCAVCALGWERQVCINCGGNLSRTSSRESPQLEVE